MNNSNNQTSRYIYMVNNTKKDIHTIPLHFTSQSDNIGFLDGLSTAVTAVKASWKVFTTSYWNSSDSIDLIKDTDCNLSEYMDKGYVMK